jgi:hypothetical protein
MVGSAKPRESQFKEVSERIDFSFASREEPIDEIAQQRFLPTRLNRRGPALAAGKVDATGSEYVFIGGTTLTPSRIVRIEADGRCISSELSIPAAGTPVNDGPILVFDANADGVNDLLLTRGGASQPAGSNEFQPILLISDGRGGFRRAAEDALPSLLMSVGAVAAADFNRDGALDLFIGGRVSPGDYPSTPVSGLLVNRQGKLVDVTATVIPALQNVGMVTASLWSDVDGDTWPDLLLTLEWGHVKYFHNSGGTGFEDWTEKAGFASAGTGWWSAITSSDFNGDGRPDYAVGNVGLNTPYRADAAHPTLLLRNDFRGNGTSLLIEGYYEGDDLYPRRTRRDLGAALPAILKRFPRNDLYARATLSEILGEKGLAAAERFAATELRSGVFMSRANAPYEFVPLPRIAQIAPLQGMVSGDFDGDGKIDLYTLQNSYAPNPVVGRFDGGLSQLLRGDGRGHFEPVPATESGLVVPGDAKALVAIDLNDDGWADFLLTRNNNTTMAFRNQPVTNRRSLRVSLRGAGGNPDGIGGRITARYTDGSSQSFEISAGSGYYSQSSSDCFIGSPDSNPLNKIEVRWPMGKTSVHEVPAAGKSLTLTEPTD